MSAVLGVLAPPGTPPPETPVIRRMLRAMAGRGTERTEVCRDAHWLVGVGTAHWEADPHVNGPTLLAGDGAIVVAADASLYYRNDLRLALKRAGVAPASDAPAHLVLAAYQAWGVECPKHLEGDFSFIVFDRDRCRLLAARDFGGKRPLFWAEVDRVLVVASTIAGILEYPSVPEDLDFVALASEVSGLTGSADETCYRSVRRLPAGWSLVRRNQGVALATPHWHPPKFHSFSNSDSRAAAARLRDLIGRATVERMAPFGPTALCMSGGYDSTAVYGGGRWMLKQSPGGLRLEPISVSYPPGDSGNEDQYIEAVLHHWGSHPRWVRIEPLMGEVDVFLGASGRDEPGMFPFEPVNRALARKARELGSRVMLDGYGGDQLFGASSHYMADLLRGGRWRTLAGEWIAEAPGSWRQFFKVVVQPNLPRAGLRLVESIRGRPIAESRGLWREPAPWLSSEFIHEHSLLERERRLQPPRGDRDIGAYEIHWHLMVPEYPRFTALMNSAVLEEGVEVRSPLYDRRVIEFMATQPIYQRRSLGENKRLLRHSMMGLLPDKVLAPRRQKTGVPRDYLVNVTRVLFSEVPTEVLESPVLADLGIVDARRLQEAANASMASPKGAGFEVLLLLTLLTELWLREHLDVKRAPIMQRDDPVTVSA